MARLLIDALRAAGHEVELAARLRSLLARPDPAALARLAEIGARLATRIVTRYRDRPPAMRPALWFTYHLYYKAPDWIGPPVCDALGLPYVVAEASFAPKRAGGAWALSHAATERALQRADAVIGLNSHDSACVRPVLRKGAIFTFVPPFLDRAPFVAAAAARSEHRARLAARYGLPLDEPWLLVVAMMREGDKLASYRLLGAALRQIRDTSFHLLVAGDGPARPAVVEALGTVAAARIHWLGEVEAEALPALYAGADLFPWPAVNEAYGMALLEAQAAGLPVLAGCTGGVPDIVADGKTGRLVPAGDAMGFAEALRALLDQPALRRELGAAAIRRTAEHHDMAGAVAKLDAALRSVTTARGNT
jgi:glycosyltransferase involved in cell wall biosynthesis